MVVEDLGSLQESYWHGICVTKSCWLREIKSLEARLHCQALLIGWPGFEIVFVISFCPGSNKIQANSPRGKQLRDPNPTKTKYKRNGYQTTGRCALGLTEVWLLAHPELKDTHETDPGATGLVGRVC